MLWRLLLVSLVLVIVGCASIDATVKNFHTLPLEGRGETFEFSAILPSLQKSLEHQSYLGLIRERLAQHGWVYDDTGMTKYYVAMFYHQAGANTVSGSVPVFGQTGGGTSYTTGSIYGAGGSVDYTSSTMSPVTTGQVGSIPYSRTIYTHELSIYIYDGHQADLPRVYEGLVTSSGNSGEEAEVVPAMLAELLRDFPGKSGQVKNVHRSRW